MQKYVFKNIFLLLLLTILYILCVFGKARTNRRHHSFDEVRCNSATIRSVKDFNNKLNKCTLVTGYVRIVEMKFTPSELEQVKPSNIEEISEYLLVYHVQGLDSLERLFPKLVIIRGVKLLYDKYALIILENQNLENIGLVSLLRVLKGSIRVELNPSLCFAQTINWVLILGETTKQYFYVVENNKPPSQCPVCHTYDDELETIEVNRHKKCWSIGKFQKTSWDYIDGKTCNQEQGQHNCLTSCSESDCRHCTNFVSDTGCVVNCLPFKYRLAFKRQCVRNCAEWGLIQFGLECVEKCPKHYQEIYQSGSKTCALNCAGKFIVHNAEDLEGLTECSTIDGSLIIEIYETDKPIVSALEKSFRNLNEIKGYLKIVNSPQIISLHFFKNLHTIGGSDLLEDMYSLYVVDNNYLEELWTENVAIIRGCIYFHLNPRLCYEKITNLAKNFRECTEITVKDVSEHSNGERVVCDEDIHLLNATVTDLNSNSAVIEVDVIRNNDFFLLIGYIYYYKEAPNKNVTKYDGRHGCGSDGWFTDVVLDKRRRHVLKNLKPGTQYAYFVSSMTNLEYTFYVEFITDILYFETLPTKPEVVAKLYAHSLSPTDIELHWWPPRITNGIIAKYVLKYEETNITMTYESIDKDTTEVCQCPKLDTESNVPTPHVENYYNKEQLLHKDVTLNFLLVKRESSNDSETKTRLNSLSSDEIKELFLKLERDAEEKSTKEQEKEKESYVLPHPPPVCNPENPFIQEQTEKKCTKMEKYEGAIEIFGNQHKYVLKNLEPGKTYRISLRACVKNLANGCGTEKVILSETVSKRLENLLNNITFHKS